MTDAIVTKESTAIAEYQLDISPDEIHSLIVSNVGEDQLSIWKRSTPPKSTP
jgi:hypothetical protein